MEELIDVYDANRERTGAVVPRKGARLSAGQYMLYVYALVEDADGRFLVTRRALDKPWAPGAWEVPGGGVAAGETPWRAICREVSEETGLDVSAQPQDPVYSYRNDDPEGGDNYFADVFHFRLDFAPGDVVLQRSEAIDARLVTWDEATMLAVQGAFLHYERLRQALDAEGEL